MSDEYEVIVEPDHNQWKGCDHEWGNWFEPPAFYGKAEARICSKCQMQQYRNIKGAIAVPVDEE